VSRAPCQIPLTNSDSRLVPPTSLSFYLPGQVRNAAAVLLCETNLRLRCVFESFTPKSSLRQLAPKSRRLLPSFAPLFTDQTVAETFPRPFFFPADSLISTEQALVPFTSTGPLKFVRRNPPESLRHSVSSPKVLDPFPLSPVFS